MPPEGGRHLDYQLVIKGVLKGEMSAFEREVEVIWPLAECLANPPDEQLVRTIVRGLVEQR